MGYVNRDRNTEFTVRQAINPAAHTTAQTGLAVDTQPTSGRSAKNVTFVVTAGVVTDGTIDLTVEESDTSGGTYTAIAAARIFGTLAAAFTAAADERSVAISVLPAKRFVRINTVETVASAGYNLGAVCILEDF